MIRQYVKMPFIASSLFAHADSDAFADSMSSWLSGSDTATPPAHHHFGSQDADIIQDHKWLTRSIQHPSGLTNFFQVTPLPNSNYSTGSSRNALKNFHGVGRKTSFESIEDLDEGRHFRIKEFDSTKPVIFQDVDGVLNSEEDGRMIDPKLVERLDNLVEQTGAQIVLSSHWRKTPGYSSFDDLSWTKNFRVKNICKKVIISKKSS